MYSSTFKQNNLSKSSSSPVNHHGDNNFFFQPKLIINTPHDTCEQEADAMADKVMRMQMPELINFSSAKKSVHRMCDHCEEEEEKQLQKKESNNNTTSIAPSIVHDVLNSTGGKSLDADTRAFMEPRFNYDFSNVKIHDSDLAAESSDSINALAYTSGNHIVFNSGQYNPSSDPGKKLLAHELTHVVQQKSISGLQRQPTGELKQSFKSPRKIILGKDISKMEASELYLNMWELEDELSKYTVCNPYTASLEKEIGRYIVQLNIVQGKTFSPEAIASLRGYHKENAALDAKDQKCDSCIVAMNKGYTKLYGQTAKELGTTPHSVEKTMEGMESKGLVGDTREIYFLNKRGIKTTGAAYPDKLEKSVWDSVLEMSNKDEGWIVFGMSLMDGEHSVTLTLDNNTIGYPKVFWSDQWGSKGGWKEFNKAGLDGEITKLIQSWWKKMEEGKKHTTVVRLWRLKSK